VYSKCNFPSDCVNLHVDFNELNLPSDKVLSFAYFFAYVSSTNDVSYVCTFSPGIRRKELNFLIRKFKMKTKVIWEFAGNTTTS